MKVAHFSVFGPNKCGLYHTVKDLILAEREVGIDAQLVVLGEDFKVKPGVKDGPLCSVDVEWCKQADIFVRHSGIPGPMQSWGKPIILAMHGRPESSFRLERDCNNPVVTAVAAKVVDERYKAFIYFWPEYELPWSMLVPAPKLHYVPAPIDATSYQGGHDMVLPGAPRLLIADIWRDDVTPFNSIWGAVRFGQKYAPQTKIYIVGMSGKKERSAFEPFRRGLERSGFLGRCDPMTQDIGRYYASCDILVTPHVIATRVVREALATGLPIVAGAGCRYTPFTANPMDIEGVADAIHKCWLADGSESASYQTYRGEFSARKTGLAMQRLFQSVLTPAPVKRKVFVDIGGHTGESIRSFFRQVPDARHWEIHSFEPDPDNATLLREVYGVAGNVRIWNKAAWTEQTSLPLYRGHVHNGEGSTLLDNKQTGAVDYLNPMLVDTVDLSAWLMSLTADEIVMKMNVEGAEYHLLPHLIETGALNKISRLYVQTHAAKFPRRQQMEYLAIEEHVIQAAEKAGVTAKLVAKGMPSFAE